MYEPLYKVIYKYHLRGNTVNKYSSPTYIPESLYNRLKSDLKNGSEVPYLLDGITVYLTDMYIEKKMRSVFEDGKI